MMTTSHERWPEFYGRPAAAVGDSDGSGCTSSLERPLARRILMVMGFAKPEIDASFDYFEQHGGYCHCEVLLNVGAEGVIQ